MNREKRRSFNKVLDKCQNFIFNQTFNCLDPECKCQAIKSHSQQRNGPLKQIAKEGRVYTLTPNFKPAFKITKKTDPLEIRSIPISKASTFLGFCNNHDRDLFLDLECEELGSKKSIQATLVLLRAISYEYTLKREMKLFNDKLRELLETPHYEPDSIDFVHESWANEYGQSLLSEIFNIVKQKNWNRVRSRWFQINHQIDISACGLTQVEFNDFSDDLSSFDAVPLMAFYLVSQENKTTLILSYFEEHSLIVNRKLGTLKDNQAFSHFLNKLIFSDCEDSCYGPRFWEGLSKDEKEQICLSIRHPHCRDEDYDFPQFIDLTTVEIKEL